MTDDNLKIKLISDVINFILYEDESEYLKQRGDLEDLAEIHKFDDIRCNFYFKLSNAYNIDITQAITLYHHIDYFIDNIVIRTDKELNIKKLVSVIDTNFLSFILKENKSFNNMFELVMDLQKTGDL